MDISHRGMTDAEWVAARADWERHLCGYSAAEWDARQRHMGGARVARQTHLPILVTGGRPEGSRSTEAALTNGAPVARGIRRQPTAGAQLTLAICDE